LPVAAAASLPVAGLLGKGALELAQTPVIGWQRTVRQLKGRKHPKEVVTQHSFSLRAWEVAAAAGVALVGSWILLNRDGLEKLKEAKEWKPFLWLSPPLGAAVWLSDYFTKQVIPPAVEKAEDIAISVVKAVPSEALVVSPISPALGVAITLWDWISEPSGPTPAPYYDIPPGPGK